MTSKERILSCLNGKAPDHVPLTTWCFGVKPHPSLSWTSHGKQVNHWYSKRMEHLHTLPYKWNLDDECKRVHALQSLGVDDLIDISIPWSTDPEVTWTDKINPPASSSGYPVMSRTYSTPSGTLRHAVNHTGEKIEDGWVIQPDTVHLIEDYNIPRAVKHAVSDATDVPIIQHLYTSPDEQAEQWFEQQMGRISHFAEKQNIAVQAWTAFGMDGVIWLTGVEGAVIMAMEEPIAFGRLVDIIAETDFGRTKLACDHPSIDLVVQRGWYSSTDFWSPDLFDEYVIPHVRELAQLTHKHGKKFGYVITTGVNILGERLADAGVDILYFVDPVQDTISLEFARDNLSDKMTIAGGINTVSLSTSDNMTIQNEIESALTVLGPTNRFILHPVDALFPDTPWERIEQLIELWKTFR